MRNMSKRTFQSSAHPFAALTLLGVSIFILIAALQAPSPAWALPRNLGVGSWTQEAKLIAPNGRENDRFGASVALSADGAIALVGADRYDGVNKENQGAVYVFAHDGQSWSLQAMLTAPDGAEFDYFGEPVALSADGRTALIAAPIADAPVSRSGAAYVFIRNGNAWSFQSKLTPSDPSEYKNFGADVTLSADGNTALVGAIGDNGYVGAVYVFVRQGGTWTQQAKLTASDGAANDYFGGAVALSSDGNRALIGAVGASVNSNDTGAVYVFERQGGAWRQQAKLSPSDVQGRHVFGRSVALSSDGGIALIGDRGARIGGNDDQGAAYVFALQGSSWIEQAKLIASDGAESDGFGASVALSQDGSIAAILTETWVSDPTRTGAAYVFERSGGSWAQTAKLTASDGVPDDEFGDDIALTGDGNLVLVGVSHADVAGKANQGAAYIFRKDSGATPPPGGCPDTYEPNDDFAQARTITPGTAIQAYICTDQDVDYFKFTAAAGQRITIDLTDIPAGNDYDLWLSDPNQVQVGSSTNSGNADERIEHTAALSGEYFVVVNSYTGASATQPYRLNVTLSGGTTSTRVFLPLFRK